MALGSKFTVLYIKWWRNKTWCRNNLFAKNKY